MDGDSLPSLLTIVIFVALSAYFSATETAFSSLNRVRLKNLAKNGNRRAALVLQLSDDYDKLLSTILVGNNIVNIATAAVGTALFIRLYGDIGATISTIVVTIVVLIFGEISPKSLAKESPERFAMFAAPLLRLLLIVLTPVNFLFSLWKKLLKKAFHAKDEPGMTEEELLTIVEEAEQDGAINEEDSELIHSVIDFNDLKVNDVLTPRVDIVGVALDDGQDRIARTFLQSGYSRLPVYRETVDRIVGVLNEKDFFNGLMGEGLVDVEALMQPPLFVPPSARISNVLRLLQRKKTHLAVVPDEYGGTFGIVTMEDILEELVGEIWDEHDDIVEDIVQTGVDTWQVNGLAELDKLFGRLGMERDDTEAVTVGGWIMERLGRIPQTGDGFACGRLHVTVDRTHERRVTQATVRILP